MERPLQRRRLGPNTRINVETLQSMPPEIQHDILKEICENGFADFWRVKSTCKALRDVSDTPAFHRDVDLLMMQAPDFPDDGVVRFKNLCLHDGSPSALYLKGTHNFFKEGNLEIGLEGIRLSAVGGYDLARYAYEMIHRIMNPQIMVVAGMSVVTKDFVRRMRVEVDFLPNIAWPTFDSRPPMYDEMVNLIPVEDVFACRCSQNWRWPPPWFEECKEGPMCDRCFWLCQTSWFSRNWPDQHHQMNPRIMF